jgi:uncharacterized protein (TIGR03435 family)
VASIRPNNNSDGSGIIKPTPAGLTIQNASVSFCIDWAWNIQDYRVSIPGSLKSSADSAHYDIVAKAAGPVPIDQLRLMLRNLLVDRFHLAVHFEKRDLPVFALVVAKGGPKQLHDPAANVEKHVELASTDRARAALAVLQFTARVPGRAHLDAHARPPGP